MCGRYVIEIDEPSLREIVAEAQRRLEEGVVKTGEIFPSNTAPVLAEGNGGLLSLPMTWGFPRWDGKGLIINARAETAAQKKTFSGPLKKGRVAVPTSGFYEWKKLEGGKQKYHFGNGGVLYLAGISSAFQGVNCYSILTTAANQSMQPYHSRMPVLLQQQELPLWFGEGYETLLQRVPFAVEASAVD